MRLHIGGTVILLDRKQASIVALLFLLFGSGTIFVLFRLGSMVSSSNEDIEELRPIQIEEVIGDRLQQQQQLIHGERRFRRRDVEDEMDSKFALKKGSVDDVRDDDDGGRHKASERRSKSLKKVVMAMDIAKQRRGSVIRTAQQRLIANQHRAPDARYNINVTLSDMTSLDRPLPDTRPPICLTTSLYNNETEAADLPTMTVIIPFYNEALTMLLRAVHSVLNRSPDRLLDEVILVDDCSTDPDLQGPLVDYISLLPKVRLVRNSHRQGLIVSRMRGARMAQSPTIFFMDAHAEANAGWLEPLLFELKRNPKQVLQPFVDGIDAMTLNFNSPGVYHKGAFSWDLRYTWIRVKDHEQQQAVNSGIPFFSPTLVGCAIAVQRDYFFHIGSFDEGMRVWGGENIELGFRTWMCGGEVSTVTCSRVGHVFKEFPYQFDGNKEDIVQQNLIRVAETWMDGMRKYFYASTRVFSFKRAEITDKADLESLQERKRLREKLKCHSFDWFMYNVIQKLSHLRLMPIFMACWEVTTDYYVTITYVCYHHKIIPENNFSLMPNGLLRYFDRCVGVRQAPFLSLIECPSTQVPYSRWELKKRNVAGGSLVFHMIRSDGRQEDWCISQVTNAMPHYRGSQMPQLIACDDSDEFQQWSFTYEFDWPRVPPHALRR